MNWEVEKEMVVEKRDSQAPPSPGSSPDTEESFTEKMFCGAGVGRGGRGAGCFGWFTSGLHVDVVLLWTVVVAEARARKARFDSPTPAPKQAADMRAATRRARKQSMHSAQQ